MATTSPHARGLHTPGADGASLSTHEVSMSPELPPPHASELDTTMEDAEEEEGHGDDEFAFNAPSYYDLKNPEMEQQYVNNADGYFYQEETLEFDQFDAPQTPPRATSLAPTMDLNGRTPQTPYGHYREPHHSEDDSDAEMADDARADEDDHMSDGGRSDDTLVLDQLATPPTSASAQSQSHSSRLPPPPPRSLSHSQGSGGSSVPASLLQPTQAYLMRMQAEQAARERQMIDSSAEHGNRSKLTQPRSPRLRTTQKAMQRHTSEPKLSSTSRELQKIQEEKMRVQMETMKIREFHERVRAQRVPANVHQRSTKQLTIPQSPYLEVGHRSATRRRLNQSMSGSEDGSTSATDREEPHPYIPPEQLLSRDFEFPAAHARQPNNGHHDVTVPHTPHLRTSERARRNVFPLEESPESHHVDYSKMKVNGVTKPVTPQFETDRRAHQAASYRKPIERVDKDAEELKRKFHARPVPRKIFEAKKNSPKKATSQKPVLTRPMSPKLATSARARQNHPPVEEEKPLSASHGPPRRTGPVVPETPPLRSLYRHKLYQENLRRRQEAEEEEMRRQREFKAQPIRVTTTPPRFEGSKRPLTEVQPFALRGDRLHERAQERLERKRREEEERLRAGTRFKAKPMPVLTPEEDSDRTIAPPRAPARQLTKPSSPKLSTDRRAAERAAFEAAERERRAREEEYKKQIEEEKRRHEEEEIKRLRREQLTFHARPVPVPKAFEVKPATRPLTEPESPFLQTKIRGGGVSNNSATTAA